MALLSIIDLGVTFGTPLFTKLTFAVADGDRLGIVAANGRGKSTLLRCLAGEAETTSGEITRSRGLRIAHVAQEMPPWLAALTLYDMVCAALPAAQAETESWRSDIVLDDLEVPAELRTRAVSDLSQGWQRFAALAHALVGEPDMLLLDEPTNHLDLTRIAQLEAWVAALPRAFPLVICSHDRAFLDATTNRTLFLRPEQSRAFALPYSKARAALDAADASADRQYQQDIKQAQQLRRQAAKLKNIGVNSGSDLLIVKTKQLKDRAERLEIAARPAHKENSAGAIRLGNSGTHARALIRIEDCAVTTPDGGRLLRTGKQWIGQGDRIVLLGPNGAGKTRLVDLLRRAVQEPGAVAGIGATPSVVMGYADQTLSGLDRTRTPLAEICQRFDIGDQAARTLLAGAGMDITLQGRRIGLLSGGQLARLSMLALRLTQPNFYLLDEPTNHLDIDGQEALETELCAHQATCLVVSHDRSFIRAVGNRFWVIERQRLVEVDSPEPFFAAMAAAGR